MCLIDLRFAFTHSIIGFEANSFVVRDDFKQMSVPVAVSHFKIE